MYNQSVVAVPYDNEHFFNYAGSGGVLSFMKGIDDISKTIVGTEYLFTPVTETSLKIPFLFSVNLPLFDFKILNTSSCSVLSSFATFFLAFAKLINWTLFF